jgi:hypothetical protein
MSSPNRLQLSAALALALGAASSGAATAQGVPYGYVGYSYGYGEPLLRGDYIGAPLTRFPRPSELVPSAWGYGTYGIPTVAGIRSAPAGVPTVYIIDRPEPAIRRRAASPARILSRGKDGAWSQAEVERGAGRNAGAQIISVRTPSR